MGENVGVQLIASEQLVAVVNGHLPKNQFYGWSRPVLGLVSASKRYLDTRTYDIDTTPWHADMCSPRRHMLPTVIHQDVLHLRPRDRCGHAKKRGCRPSWSAPQVTLESCTSFVLLEIPAPVPLAARRGEGWYVMPCGLIMTRGTERCSSVCCPFLRGVWPRAKLGWSLTSWTPTKREISGEGGANLWST